MNFRLSLFSDDIRIYVLLEVLKPLKTLESFYILQAFNLCKSFQMPPEKSSSTFPLLFLLFTSLSPYLLFTFPPSHPSLIHLIYITTQCGFLNTLKSIDRGDIKIKIF